MWKGRSELLQRIEFGEYEYDPLWQQSYLEDYIFEAKVDEMVKSSGMEADKIREYYMSNEQMKKNMMYAIKEEKTFAALKADLKIK